MLKITAAAADAETQLDSNWGDWWPDVTRVFENRFLIQVQKRMCSGWGEKICKWSGHYLKYRMKNWRMDENNCRIRHCLVIVVYILYILIIASSPSSSPIPLLSSSPLFSPPFPTAQKRGGQLCLGMCLHSWSLWDFFIMKGCWICSKEFSASTEIMKFFIYSLFI